MNKPVYVAVEGIDGSGKSTMVPLLAEEMEKLYGRKPLVIDEPFTKLNPLLSTARDYQKDRKKHLRQIAKRHKGEWIVSDRSFVSTLAYQPMTSRQFNSICRWAKSKHGLGRYYTVLVYLDTDIQTAQKRIWGRPEKMDETDMNLPLQQAVKRRYDAIAKERRLFDKIIKCKPGDTAQTIVSNIMSGYILH